MHFQVVCLCFFGANVLRPQSLFSAVITHNKTLQTQGLDAGDWTGGNDRESPGVEATAGLLLQRPECPQKENRNQKKTKLN